MPRSQTEGARWLQRAAAHGYVEAQSLLAALCLHGLAGAAGGDAPEASRGPVRCLLPMRRSSRISSPP